MNAISKTPAPTNLREAYVRRHPGCEASPERHLLPRCMGLRARILYRLLGGFRPHSFNPDLALVESLETVRSVDDLESRLEEFHDQNRIDRSFRRRVLGVRVSSARLRNIAEPLLSDIEVAVSESGSAPVPLQAAAAPIPNLRPAELRSQAAVPA